MTPSQSLDGMPLQTGNTVIKKKLHVLSLSVFLQTQMFLLPFLLLFYQSCGLSVGDFFLFQGIFSLAALLLEIPMGYLGDVFPKRNILILSYTFFIVRLLLWLFFARYGYWIILLGEVLYAAQKTAFAGVAESYIYECLKYHNIPQEMEKYYGNMNFYLALGTAFSAFISTPIYSFTSKYTLAKYGQNYAFFILIGLELILNLAAVYLLFRLPKIPQTPPPRGSLKQTYKRLFASVAWALQNNNIKHHMFYSAAIAAVTLIFAWSFQPLIEFWLLPVSLYGIAYFINYAFRAFVSLYLDKLKQMIPLSKMSVLTFVLFVVSFLLVLIMLNFRTVSVFWGIFCFIFISFTIAIQLAFRLLCICRLYLFIPADMRSTLASLNSAASRLYGGVFFILIKVLLDGISLRNTFLICFIIFIVLSFPLKELYSIQVREDGYEKK